MTRCHDEGAAVPTGVRRGATLSARPARVALIGSPNAGKSTLFNALTGGRAKTANYPGVTVTRREGRARLNDGDLVVIDLPGTYSLNPTSPDEQVVADYLRAGADQTEEAADALVLVADATTLQRSLLLVAEALQLGRPTLLVVTMIDELEARAGHLDLDALGHALGVPVIGVVAHRRIGLDELRRRLADIDRWECPVMAPPVDDTERAAWITSILLAARADQAQPDARTRRLDAVLLHPVAGTVIFAAVMVVFFQLIFTVAAPAQDAIGALFGWLSDGARSLLPGFVGDMVADGALAGVGTVVEFLPQIVLLFLVVSFLENVGYLARAAFVIDRVMGRFGLEGRCFVSMLSSFACAVPGIMSTRSIPSSRDRLATIMGAPLMTCAARLPVFTLLIGVFVPDRSVLGPLRLPGLVLLGLYLLGALSGLLAAGLLKITLLRDAGMFFYMELPPYRWPTTRTVGLQVWDAARSFLRKAGTVILASSLALWVLLHVPTVDAPSGMDGPAAAQYEMQRSAAGRVGTALEPVFAPLGFDWRVNVAIVGSLSAREVFVSTLAQTTVGSEDAELSQSMRELSTPEGDKLFNAATVAALLVFFVFALQCMSTIAVMRRETNSWRWPALAFCSMFAMAYGGGWIAYRITMALT